jgi:hypothetical protein
MFQVSFEPDAFGELVCTFADSSTHAVITASNEGDPMADLLAAVDSAAANGIGECFWPRESGIYRFLLRRDHDRVTIVVLWSAGTMTGWENVFWSECDWTAMEQAIRREAIRTGQYR